jgi:hypothetical protein
MTNRIIIKYEMNEKETATAESFLEEHKNCDNGAAIGGAITWLITSTSIGQMCFVRCNRCDKNKSITDYILL